MRVYVKLNIKKAAQQEKEWREVQFILLLPLLSFHNGKWHIQLKE